MRRCIDIAAVICFILSAILALLWVRSYGDPDVVGWGLWGHDAMDPSHEERWFVGVEGWHGVFVAGALREREGGVRTGGLVRSSAGLFWKNNDGWPLGPFVEGVSGFTGFGFRWLDDPPPLLSDSHNGLVLSAPFWAMVAIFSTGPVLWGRRRFREAMHRKRSLRGLCPVCGYDLRSSFERCPECGTMRNGAAQSDTRSG